MAQTTFIAFPTSCKKLSDEAIRVIDLYQMAQITEPEVQSILKAWKENVPNLLLDADGTRPSAGLARYIGKRRSMVLVGLLSK